MARLAAEVSDRWLLRQGHLNAALMGSLLAQVAFWLWFALPRLSTESFGADDFAAFWSITSLVLDGRASHIYDLQAVAARQAALGLPQTVPYFYPPFFLAFVLPFGLLSPGLAYLLWGAANLLILAVSTWLLARALVPRADRLTFALLVFSSMPAGRNLYLGQSAFVLLAGLAIAVLGFLGRQDRRAGIGSTMMLIKPQLLPVWVLTLLWYRRFRALAHLALGSAALMLLSTAIVGLDGMTDYVKALLFAGTADKVGFQAVGSHTLAGLAYTLAGEGASQPAYMLLAGAIMAVFTWCLFRARRKAESNLRIAAALAVVTALLVSPHSLMYDLVLWTIPLAIFWPELSRGRGRWMTAAGYLMPWFVSFFGMLGAGFVWPTVTVAFVGFVLLVRETILSTD